MKNDDAHLIMTYEQSARIIALHLDRFCDKSFSYPYMVADASRKSSSVIRELTEAAKATLALWDKHGLGDDDNESEPVYRMLKSAIAKATEGRG